MVAVDAVVRSGTVRLYDQVYPILGPVQRTMMTPFPSKVTQGDYARDDEIITSSWVMSDWTGGIGVENGEMPMSQDRFFDSTLDTRWPQALTLAPRLEVVSEEGGGELGIDFNDRFYITRGDDLYRWDEGAGEFSEVISFPSRPRQLLVYRNKLFVTLTDGENLRYSSNGSSFTAVSDTPLELIVEWHDYLWGMELDGSFHKSEEGTGDWESAGKLHKPDGWCRHLIIYFDQQFIPSIHAVCRDGLYGYHEERHITPEWDEEASTTQWVETFFTHFTVTPFTWPIATGEVHAFIWRSELYVAVGAMLYNYNLQTVQVIGPERGEGLPPESRGEITAVSGAHSFYYLGITAESGVGGDESTEDWIFLAGPGNTQVVHETNTRGVALASQGVALHPVFRDPDSGLIMRGIFISDVQGTYRVWFSGTTRMYSQRLPKIIHNPLRNPHYEFEKRGYLITPWFDSNWAEIDKLALTLKVTSENVTWEEAITFYVQFDDEETWTHIGGCACQAQWDEHSGRDVFPIDVENGGRVFRRVRFRVEMERGDDVRLAPVLRSMALSYMLVPDMLWGYQFTVDLSGGDGVRSERQMLNDLIEAAEQKRAGWFFFRDETEGKTVQTRSKISRIQTAEHGGDDYRGRAIVSVTQLQSAD